MFALKSHRLGKTKKQTDVPRMTDPHPEHDADDTIKTRFQEIGPQMTLKMRWIRRGPLGETGDERTARERFERETGERAEEFGERAEGAGEEEEGAEDGMDVDGEGEANAGAGASDEEGDDEADEDADAAEEAEARRAIGLDASDAAGQPNFPRPAPSASSSAATASTSAHPSASPSTSSPSSAPPAPAPESKKRPRTTPRVRKKPYHALLNPPPSDSPSPEPEEVPLPTVGKKKNPALQSAIETVGKTWHAGKGEGGVREGAKRREWNWEVSRRLLWALVGLFLLLGSPSLTTSLLTLSPHRPRCRSRGASSSSERNSARLPSPSRRLCVRFPSSGVPPSRSHLIVDSLYSPCRSPRNRMLRSSRPDAPSPHRLDRRARGRTFARGGLFANLPERGTAAEQVRAIPTCLLHRTRRPTLPPPRPTGPLEPLDLPPHRRALARPVPQDLVGPLAHLPGPVLAARVRREETHVDPGAGALLGAHAAPEAFGRARVEAGVVGQAEADEVGWARAGERGEQAVRTWVQERTRASRRRPGCTHPLSRSCASWAARRRS